VEAKVPLNPRTARIVQVYLPMDLAQALAAEAARICGEGDRPSVSRIARQAIREFLERSQRPEAA
jgi:hypothetical protein